MPENNLDNISNLKLSDGVTTIADVVKLLQGKALPPQALKEIGELVVKDINDNTTIPNNRKQEAIKYFANNLYKKDNISLFDKFLNTKFAEDLKNQLEAFSPQKFLEKFKKEVEEYQPPDFTTEQYGRLPPDELPITPTPIKAVADVALTGLPLTPYLTKPVELIGKGVKWIGEKITPEEPKASDAYSYGLREVGGKLTEWLGKLIEEQGKAGITPVDLALMSPLTKAKIPKTAVVKEVETAKEVTGALPDTVKDITEALARKEAFENAKAEILNKAYEELPKKIEDLANIIKNLKESRSFSPQLLTSEERELYDKYKALIDSKTQFPRLSVKTLLTKDDYLNYAQKELQNLERKFAIPEELPKQEALPAIEQAPKTVKDILEAQTPKKIAEQKFLKEFENFVEDNKNEIIFRVGMKKLAENPKEAVENFYKGFEQIHPKDTKADFIRSVFDKFYSRIRGVSAVLNNISPTFQSHVALAVEPHLNKITKYVKNLKDPEMYYAAEHLFRLRNLLERTEQGVYKEVSPEVVKNVYNEYLETLAKKYSPEDIKKIEEIDKMLVDFTNTVFTTPETRKLMKEAFGLTDEKINEILAKYPHYLPDPNIDKELAGIVEEFGGSSGKIYKFKSYSESFLKGKTGESESLFMGVPLDVFGSIVDGVETKIYAAAKKKHINELLYKLKDATGFRVAFEKGEFEKEASKIPFEERIKYLPTKVGNKIYYVKGDISQVLNTISIIDTDFITKNLINAKNLLRETGLFMRGPIYAARTISRDLLEMPFKNPAHLPTTELFVWKPYNWLSDFIYKKTGKRILSKVELNIDKKINPIAFKDYYKSLKENIDLAYKGEITPELREALSYGALTPGALASRDISKTINRIMALQRLKKLEINKNTPSDVFNALSLFYDNLKLPFSVWDNANKYRSFMMTRDLIRDLAKSDNNLVDFYETLEKTRQISVDFSKSGSNKYLSTLSIYINPTLQGFYGFYGEDSFLTKQEKILRLSAAMAGLAGLYSYLKAKGVYITLDTASNSILVITPMERKVDNVTQHFAITLPMPQVLQPLAPIVYRKIYGHDEIYDPKKYPNKLVLVTADTFKSLVDNIPNMISEYSMISILRESAMNVNPYSQSGKIYRGDENVKGWMQFNPETENYARSLGEYIGLSPAKLEYLTKRIVPPAHSTLKRIDFEPTHPKTKGLVTEQSKLSKILESILPGMWINEKESQIRGIEDIYKPITEDIHTLEKEIRSSIEEIVSQEISDKQKKKAEELLKVNILKLANLAPEYFKNNKLNELFKNAVEREYLGNFVQNLAKMKRDLPPEAWEAYLKANIEALKERTKNARTNK